MKLPKCKWCKKPYIPKTAWQEFDKEDCQQEWHMEERKKKRQKAVAK
jgi:hypothetical protein